MFMVANHLSFEVKKDVQIVDLKKISTVFSAQIVGTGEVLQCENEELMDNQRICKVK